MERIIDFGKNKGKTLAECEVSYLKWLATHEQVLAKRNRWAARDARFLLLRQEQAAKVAAYEEVALQQVEKTIQPISSPTEDRMMKAALTTNRGFSLMR